jgi:hypothetical protein
VARFQMDSLMRVRGRVRSPRGISMAQLRDLVRAKALVRSVTRAFGSKETVSARGVVAVAEMSSSRPRKQLHPSHSSHQIARKLSSSAAVSP